MEYPIVRLQVQRVPMKTGRAPLRRYEPAAIVPVSSINAGPRGVQGVTAEGQTILDVHHRDHPHSRDRRGKAGILFMGTGDYDALRERYGDHLVNGIAGETMLLAAPDGLAGRRLPKTIRPVASKATAMRGTVSGTTPIARSRISFASGASTSSSISPGIPRTTGSWFSRAIPRRCRWAGLAI